jgi:hypothetical protein
LYELRKNCEEKTRKYLEEANRLVKEGLANEKIERFYSICYILTDMIKGGMEHSISLKELIKRVIMETKPESVETFLTKLNEYSKLDQPKSRYFFVATSNLDICTLSQRTFEIMKTKIRLMSFAEAEKEFGISKLFKEWLLNSTDEISEFMRYSYVSIDVETSTAGDAAEKGFAMYELFRGLLNFADHYAVSHYTYYSGIPHPKALSTMEPARVQMIFNEKKEHLFDRFTIGFFDHSIKRFHSDREKLLLHLIGQINSFEDCPLAERCLSAFRKYNDGLDGNVAGTSFLEFWKILELVALSDTEEGRMPEIKVANRISFLFKTDFYRDLLHALCDKRNFITHIGSLPEFDQDEMNIIRKCCEVAIIFLLEYVNKFRNESTLACFYENLPKNNVDLERVEKVIYEIRKLRSMNGHV